MKKILAALIATLVLSLSAATVGYAGDVPEGLLNEPGAQVYFGKIVKVTDADITILPLKKIKGDVPLGQEITYDKGIMMGGGKAQVGKTYLIGYVDENNLYYWATDSMDARTLKITNASAMDLRLQKYLNDGSMEQAESKRLTGASASASPAATAQATTVAAVATASPAVNAMATPEATIAQAAATGNSAKAPAGAAAFAAAAVLLAGAAVVLAARRRRGRR